MELSQDQINKISLLILAKDIKEYISAHLEDYEEFIKGTT